MGSFNSTAASKLHPMPVDLSNKNFKNIERQKEGGETFTSIKNSDGDEEEDPCMTKCQSSNTSSPKRPYNVASYLWLVSSPITELEDNLKESVMKNRFPGPSFLISKSQTDCCHSSEHESRKATCPRPQFYSYPTVSARNKTQPFDNEKPRCSAGVTPSSGTKALRRSKSASKSNASAMFHTRSVGFGVESPNHDPVQHY